MAAVVAWALSMGGLERAAAQASGRWRYGTMSWRRLGDVQTSNRIEITVESAWRLSHPAIVVFGTQDPVTEKGQLFKVSASVNEDPLLAFGDGEMTAKFDVIVDRLEPLEDMVVGKSTFIHDYPNIDTLWNATLTMCCRVHGTWNAMRSVRLMTSVNLAPGIEGSPKFNMMPTVSLDSTTAMVRAFRVPAVSMGNRELTYSMGSEEAYGYRSKLAPTDVVTGIHPTTGVLSIDTTCHFLSGNCTLTYLGRPETVYNPHVVVVVSDGFSYTTIDFYIIMQYPGASNIPSLSLIAPPAPSPLNGLVTTAVMAMPVIEAFAGFNVQLRFRATDADAGQNVYFEYSTLPEGSTKGAVDGTNPSTQQVDWLPQASQAGKHFICAAAIDIDPALSCTPCAPGAENCIPTCPSYRRSEPRCFEVHVVDNPAPVFLQPTARVLNTYMNQELRMFVKASSGDNWADAVTLTVANVHPEGSSIVPVPGALDEFEFVWKPGRQFGGYNQDVCFRATGASGAGRVVKNTTLCVQMTVVKCMWAVGPGETLDSIATLFGSSYVQLWALNVERDSPDAALAEGDRVRIGHLYQVRATDNLRYLTVQFATTRATLEALNNNMFPAALTDKDRLTDVAGMEACILPHSCVGYNEGVA